jgi:hypothetical protein
MLFRVLDTLCPTPNGRKKRMIAKGCHECTCGIRAPASAAGHHADNATIAGNMNIRNQAFRSGIKAVICLPLFRLIPLNSGYFAYFRLAVGSPNEEPDGKWGPASADARSAMADKEAGIPIRPKGGREGANRGIFAAGRVPPSAFARLCPRLSGFARLFVGAALSLQKPCRIPRPAPLSLCI